VTVSSSRSKPRADGTRAATRRRDATSAPGAASPTANAGISAEALAARFLESRGLTVLARNFRTRRGEIDLIAQDGECLVFVEVRLRRGSSHGGAAESITHAKQARLVAAAQYYLLGRRDPPPCRFDAVLLDTLDDPRIDWRRNVIEAG
jgi:putative endonuclease